ncbi:hypothetical protein [Pseudooceanicola marinus]|uniref:hypothetical protein n=1 Tax=Pseudooceanicola marinus TaxID=396013 RepID=UPI001CD4F821|nr:hypothetical protein [Pseudooceanicola marinus]MCA1337603.1 hypothetical protein [Pseudooceanicola marinus]
MKLARLSFWLILTTGAVHFVLTGARIGAGRSDLMDMGRLLVEMALCGGLLLALYRTPQRRGIRAMTLTLGAALYLYAISGGFLWSNIGQLLIGVLACVAVLDALIGPRRASQQKVPS